MQEDKLLSGLSDNSFEEENCINAILKFARTTIEFEKTELNINKIILDFLKVDMAFIAEYDVSSVDDITFKNELWSDEKHFNLSDNQRFILQLKSFLMQMPKELFIKQLAYKDHEEFFKEVLKSRPENLLSQEFWIKSFVATPIYINNELLGVLFVAQEEYYRDWTEKELASLRKFADSLAIGMYQTQLYKRLKFYSEKQTFTNSIIEKIKSCIELADIFDSIIERICLFLDIPRGFILKHNLQFNQSEPIQFEYTADQSCKSIKEIIIDITPSKNKVFDTLINKKSEFISISSNDISINHCKQDINIISEYNIKSFCVIPILHFKQSYASIWLCSTKERVWTENQVNLIKEVANQLAMAIHQNALFKEINDTNQKLLLSYKKEQTIREILETIRTTMDLSDIYRDITEVVGKKFNVNRTYFIEYDNDKNVFLNVKEEYLSDKTLYSFKNKALPQIYINLLNHIITNKTYYIVNDQEELNIEGFKKEIGQDPETKTAIFIPIYYQNNPLGVFVASQTSYNRIWTNEEIEVLSIIANQVGSAIYQAKIYQSLQEINRIKSDFLASFSHELKTPLNSILVLSELLQNKRTIKSDEERIELLKIIHLSADELLRNINNILEIARLDTLNKNNSYINFNLRELVDEVVPIAQILTKQKNLSFMVNFDYKNNEYVYSDRKLIKLILSNLLNNAVKFTKDGFVQLIIKKVDKVFVDSINLENVCSINNNYLYIEVIDSGIGIDNSYVDKIFDDFVQVSTSETRTHSGSGLGLAICKRSVSLLGGKIWLSSKINLGSNFYVLIPL